MKHFIKYSFISLIIALTVFSVTGCSKDKENEDGPSLGNSSLTINGQKTSVNFLLTLCEDSSSGYKSLFSAMVNFEGFYHTFRIYLPSRLDDFENGEIFDEDEVTVDYFYDSTSVWIGDMDFWPVSGSITVQSITSEAITLKFSNFTFVREKTGTSGNSKEETFKVEGTLTYKIS